MHTSFAPKAPVSLASDFDACDLRVCMCVMWRPVFEQTTF